MSENNDKMPCFTFNLNDITAREMDVLIQGGSVERMAPIIAKIVVGCDAEIGALDSAETYMNLKWRVWQDMMKQLGNAAKNG